MAGHRYRGPDTVLSKRLVEEEKHTSVLRAAGLFSGMGAIAWGGSRLRYLGPSLRATRDITAKTRPGVSRYLGAAEGMRRNTERSTTAFGHAFGVGVGTLPNKVQVQLRRLPGHARPLAATVAGGTLVQVSSPVRRRSYVPVDDD